MTASELRCRHSLIFKFQKSFIPAVNGVNMLPVNLSRLQPLPLVCMMLRTWIYQDNGLYFYMEFFGRNRLDYRI